MKAVNESRFEGKTCFIHTLQQAIRGALDAQESVNEAIAAGRRIVTHFNHSQPYILDFVLSYPRLQEHLAIVLQKDM